MSPDDKREQDPEERYGAPDFEQVFAQVAAPLRAYLRRSTTEHDADDLLQEALTRFLESPRSKTLDLAACRKYIFSIATNLLRDHWRSKARTRAVENRLPVREAEKKNVEEEMGRRIDVERALNTLSERERAMLWLAHAENYTHREIASALGLRSSSVRVLLFRARRKLAAAIKTTEES